MRTGPPRGTQLVKAQSSHQTVEVEDVRLPLCKILVEGGCAARNVFTLSFCARRLYRHGVSEHANVVVLVLVGCNIARARGSDSDIVTGSPQVPGQTADVHLGAAEAFGKVPA